MAKLLLIVDVQNGFVINDSCRSIIPHINELIKKWQSSQQPVVFSRFINRKDSPWVRLMGWDKLTSSPEIDLHPDLLQNYGEIYDKTLYSAWSDEIAQICQANHVNEVLICGIDTDQCVLATALGVFETGLKPVVVTDCCASSADEKFHSAALLLLKRLIGDAQIAESKQILSATS
jgi:nicotinamidase-related amidase